MLFLTLFLGAAGGLYPQTVLTGFDGSIAGRVRKQWLAGHEFFTVKPHEGPHIIETEIGRIGVAICCEGTIRRLMKDLKAAEVDLILLPTADPVPEFAREDPPEDWDHDLTDTATLWVSSTGKNTLHTIFERHFTDFCSRRLRPGS
jgi:predicted amidohydrolase